MNKHYVSNNLIKGAYVVHYDEIRDTGYVEKVESCTCPDKQQELYKGLISNIGILHYYIFDALVAAWYSKHINCEFNKREFEDFCNSYDVPTVIPNEHRVTGCEFGFQKDHAYARIIFDTAEGNLEEKFSDSRFEDDIISDVLLPLWHEVFKGIPQVADEEHVGPPSGLPAINNSCHMVTYRIEKF